jgi:hypothetical protein
MLAGDSSAASLDHCRIIINVHRRKLLTRASGDGNTSGGSVNIEGGDGATALGGSITISICLLSLATQQEVSN